MSAMTAIMLGWDPDHREGWQFAYASAADTIRHDSVVSIRWPVSFPFVAAGADVWILLQGAHERGLLGHGTVAPSSLGTADRSADDGGSLTVDLDLLLPRGEHITESVLLDRVPGVGWDADPPSGTSLAPWDELLLRTVWAERVPASVFDPVTPIPGTLPTSALTRIAVNRHERDADAVRQCIAHHGTSCAVCRFNFEESYGELGRGFIQVHHIVPGLRVDADYVLDPLTDLVPLCPNCHAMAHRRTPEPYSPAELRRLIRPSIHLAGSVVDPVELRAQEDAARILGS